MALLTTGGRRRPAGPGWLRVLDPATLRLLSPVEATTPWPRAVADGGGATWIAGDGAVPQRTAPDGERRTLRAPGVEFLAGGALWTLTRDGVLQRRDPVTGRASGPPLDVGGHATSLATGPGVVWVGLRDRAVVRVDPAGPSVTWTRDVPVT